MEQRLLFAAVPLAFVFILLSPAPVSAVGDTLPSSAGLSPSTAHSSEAKAEADGRHHQESQHRHPGTVYTTRTEYIKVTSTKTQIPMCVTAYKPLPQCSKDDHGAWRMARKATSNEVSLERDGLERSQDEDDSENSKRSGRLLMRHMMRPLTWPLEMMGLMSRHPTPPPPQLHLHVEFSPGLNPLDPNHPLHPNNPLHAANMVNLLNGGLVAAVGLADVVANGGGGGGGGVGGGGGGLGPGFGPSGFYDGVFVEVVKEVTTVTSYVTKTKGPYTATLTAGHCMPASDTIPHCKPTAAYNNYDAYEPYYYQDHGLPSYQYNLYHVDPWSRGQYEDGTIAPSISSVVPYSQSTPPL